MQNTTPNAIPTEEIRFHPTSFCDEDGRVFWWQGSLYRGISPQYVPLCQEMFESGVVAALIAQGFLVDTELTELSLPGYPMVLKHRQIAFVSYVSEWCPEMIRDAAQFTLDMMRQLSPHGLTVDIGTWDILFEGPQPRYVDFCSIAAANTYSYHAWQGALDDFRSYFVNPLRLMNRGYGNMARWLLKDYEHRMIHAELAAMLGQHIYGHRDNNPSLIHRLQTSVSQAYSNFLSRRDPCRQDLIKQMHRELNRVLPPRRNADTKRGPTCELDGEKQRCVYKILETLRPTTVMDIGCGAGHYSRLAAQLGSQVVAVDCDDRQVTRCYRMAKTQQLSILPLVMDIRYPTPGQGSGNQVITPAIKRLSCELVIALDLLHLLIFEQHLTLPQAVDSLAAFSTRWLLIECAEGGKAQNDLASMGYSCEALMDLLRDRFQQVSVVSSEGIAAPLILCKR